jgi:hypothetical protein
MTIRKRVRRRRTMTKTETMKGKTGHHSQIGDTGELGGVFTLVQETPENVF